MSRWRQKGFVLDSDEEEEESQIESQRLGKDLETGRDERVESEEDSVQEGIGTAERSEVQGSSEEVVLEKSDHEGHATSSLSPSRERTESPDPLQSSPRPNLRQIRIPERPSPSQTPYFQPTPPTLRTESNHDAIAVSQSFNSTRTLAREITAGNAKKATNVLSIFNEFGIGPLSDDSGDESLSDPPTDLESPPPSASALPHRRTAVQVVIPSSTALQNHIMEQGRIRDFRQRKPIQLHPYALEGELYRREVQSRGLKPVPRERSPHRQPRTETETQETDFDPNKSPASSLPEREIFVSTPVVQRSRKDIHRTNSDNHPSTSTLRQHPSSQLHYPRKRRKPNVPSTQSTSVRRSIFDDDVAQRDIWSIPPNSPPFSSSPPVNRTGSAKSLRRQQHMVSMDPNLPTPSTSSIFHGDLQAYSSDSEPVVNTVQRSNKKTRQPSAIILSESESGASGSSSEPEQSDMELRKVGKKIKGVLPASWLRFDLQAQEKRKALQRERERASLHALNSPEPTEPQRGVAKRVVKRVGRPVGTSVSRTPSQDIVTISDESDDALGNAVFNQDVHIQHSAADAITLADVLDSRYADDNLSDMENDRLHLPTLGGTGSRRKRQTKVTDTFGKTKKVKLRHSNTAGTGTTRRLDDVAARKRKQARPRMRQPTLPAMSIVDVDMSTGDTDAVPQFLKIARRQALQRPDLARQSLSDKQIRLHNACDTEEANVTLLQWRQGALKPKRAVTSPSSNSRRALADKDDNQQHAQGQPKSNISSTKKAGKRSITEKEPSQSWRQTGLRMFQRTSSRKSKSHHKHNTPKAVKDHRQSFKKSLPPFRTAQLENEEGELGAGYQKTIFQKSLHRIDRQFGILHTEGQPHENPVLTRFLAEEHEAPLPSASEDNIQDLSESNLSTSNPAKKQGLIRKFKPRRVDVDAREYRQPSEPAIQEIIKPSTATTSTEIECEIDKPVLQGLGPYGTRYPTTFDIHSLVHGTYFHSSTFIGSDEFQRALLAGKAGSRDLSDSVGHYSIMHNDVTIRCGPWNDQTYSSIRDLMTIIWKPLEDQVQGDNQMTVPPTETLEHSARCFRSLITYVTMNLSFLDLIDRSDFVTKMNILIKDSFDRLLVTYATVSKETFASEESRKSIRAMSYLLVLALQVHQIAQHESRPITEQTDLRATIQSLSRTILTHLVLHGVSELNNFLEANKRHDVRANGIQDTDILVESTVICMHVLECIALPGIGFWSVVSQELQPDIAKATHMQKFECAWATIFTFLPFVGVDRSGIPTRERKLSFRGDDWMCIRDILKRLFDLYSNTSGKHSSSINDYVRASLTRCHRLIHQWHWRRPEQMLNVTFDFFGKNGLKQLRREAGLTSASYLEDLAAEQSLTLLPNETAFHIALKCLALGLRGMRDTHNEKKIRSFVFRTIPNHGRNFPKDQPLDEESLAALRNHHDLLSTLYWAASPPCRPKLDHIRHLVNHESSHREACRLNVRAWANLTTFQLSTDEPSTSANPFALWHKDIMYQTLKQYRVAKTEADDYLKSGIPGDSTGVATIMVRQTMERNQEQVIATLRDCITGMRKAIRHAKDKLALRGFLVDCEVVHLLELPHLADHRLVSVIRDTLIMFGEYAAGQDSSSSMEVEHQTNEESQDYGDFPDLDDFDSFNAQPLALPVKESRLDFIQLPLWRLLSNAFGAERLPDENLLMDCVDAWIYFAKATIQAGEKTWSHYIDSFSQVSWQQLRHTEQTRKFGPYFMAALIDCDSTVYKEHQHDFIKALLLSLVERESMLRFQYRLLHAIACTDHDHPLMKNLPFSRDQTNGIWDITVETLDVRRLALISSILSNMRDDVQITSSTDSAYVVEARARYVALLKAFMNTMKNNYQELRQGAVVTGAYVEFVQKIVQFLTQYTSEICPVLPFFTDSVAFPLPAGDPTYVVGRLCGYASKATDTGAIKQLSVFTQTVAQQAAADNQHLYLVNQLKTALCTDEALSADNAVLQSVLLQGIFPAYLEKAFSSTTAFLIARPILLSLPSILDDLMFDTRITEPSALLSIVNSVMSISHAFVRSTTPLCDSTIFFNQPHVLSSLTLMLEAMTSSLSLLEYISSRTVGRSAAKKLPIVLYMENFSIYAAEMLHDEVPQETPVYHGNANNPSGRDQYGELLSFCRRGLEDSMKTNWSETEGAVWFGQGHARREVMIDLGRSDEEKTKAISAINDFRQAIHRIFGNEQSLSVEGGNFRSDIII